MANSSIHLTTFKHGDAERQPLHEIKRHKRKLPQYDRSITEVLQAIMATEAVPKKIKEKLSAGIGIDDNNKYHFHYLPEDCVEQPVKLIPLLLAILSEDYPLICAYCERYPNQIEEAWKLLNKMELVVSTNYLDNFRLEEQDSDLNKQFVETDQRIQRYKFNLILADFESKKNQIKEFNEPDKALIQKYWVEKISRVQTLKELFAIYDAHHKAPYLNYRRHPTYDCIRRFLRRENHYPYTKTKKLFIEVLQARAYDLIKKPEELVEALRHSLFHPDHDQKFGVDKQYREGAQAFADKHISHQEAPVLISVSKDAT